MFECEQLVSEPRPLSADSINKCPPQHFYIDKLEINSNWTRPDIPYLCCDGTLICDCDKEQQKRKWLNAMNTRCQS